MLCTDIVLWLFNDLMVQYLLLYFPDLVIIFGMLVLSIDLLADWSRYDATVAWGFRRGTRTPSYIRADKCGYDGFFWWSDWFPAFIRANQPTHRQNMVSYGDPILHRGSGVRCLRLCARNGGSQRHGTATLSGTGNSQKNWMVNG